MNRFVALTMMILVPVAGVMLFCRPPQGGLRDTYESPLDQWSILDAAATLEQEARKRVELDAESLRVHARIAQKREIARRLIDNTLSLSEAALLFRGLIDECRYAALVHAANEGDSEDERICRDVIGWVEGELANYPACAGVVVAELEAEIRARFR